MRRGRLLSNVTFYKSRIGIRTSRHETTKRMTKSQSFPFLMGRYFVGMVYKNKLVLDQVFVVILYFFASLLTELLIHDLSIPDVG